MIVKLVGNEGIEPYPPPCRGGILPLYVVAREMTEIANRVIESFLSSFFIRKLEGTILHSRQIWWRAIHPPNLTRILA